MEPNDGVEAPGYIRSRGLGEFLKGIPEANTYEGFIY